MLGKYLALIFDLTPDLDLEFFKVKFQSSCISGIVSLIDVKLKESESIRYWADYMILSFHHIHDLDLEVSKSKFEIALSEEWGQYTWYKRDGSLPFMTMTLTLCDHGEVRGCTR